MDMIGERGPERISAPAQITMLRAAPALTLRDSSSLTLAAGGFGCRHIAAESIAEIQCGAPHCECSVHHRVARRAVAEHAAIFERQAVSPTSPIRPCVRQFSQSK